MHSCAHTPCTPHNVSSAGSRHHTLMPSRQAYSTQLHHRSITQSRAHVLTPRRSALIYSITLLFAGRTQHGSIIVASRNHELMRFALALLCVTSSRAGLLTQASRRSPRSWCVCHDCGCWQHTLNALWHAEVRRDNVILRCPTHSAVCVRTFWRPVRRGQHFRRQQARSKRESKLLASTMLHRDAACAPRTPHPARG